MGLSSVQIMDTQESLPQRGRPLLPGKPHEEFVVSHQIQDPSPAGRGNGFQASFSLRIVVFSLSMAIMAVALDATSLSVALPILARSLSGTAIEAFWSGTSFLLCSTVFQPTFGAFSSILGRKPVILVALAFFLAGTIVASCATNFTALLIGRAFQGFGGGGIITTTEVILADLIPLRLRGLYFGIFNGVWSFGSVIGPILGAGFSQKATWRWIFYINFPFIAISAGIMLFLVKFQPLPVSLRKSFRDIDYVGTFLFIAGITSILIPITWAGVMYDWDSWRVLVPLILGFAGIAAFLCYERFLARNPPIPLSILTTRTAIATYIGTAAHGFILWAGLYYLPLYFQAVKGYIPINSAIALFPVTFTVAPGAVITGLLITKTGRYRWTIWIGWAASTIGLGLCCLIKPETRKAEYVIFMLISGFGLGVCFSSIVFAIQASVKASEVSIAISMFSFFRTLGQTIGVAIGGTIFQNRMRVNLRSYPELSPYAIQYSKDAAALVEVIHNMQEGEAKTHLIHAYADSLRVLWGTCCGLAGLAGILSIWTREFTLDRPLDTQQGLLTNSKQESNGAQSSRWEHQT